MTQVRQEGITLLQEKVQRTAKAIGENYYEDFDSAAQRIGRARDCQAEDLPGSSASGGVFVECNRRYLEADFGGIV